MKYFIEILGERERAKKMQLYKLAPARGSTVIRVMHACQCASVWQHSIA